VAYFVLGVMAQIATVRTLDMTRVRVMTIALTLEQHLGRNDIAYDVLSHAPTTSSLRTVEASNVPADALAKTVVLKGDRGYLLAVLPASERLEWKALGKCFNNNLALATEDEIAWLFPDCKLGAVPPIGEAYGIGTVVDDSIAEQADIYFEGGDHATLVHLAGPAFCKLMARAKHGRFSTQH
jgi:Ala-tRNA(Pro) deacylase